MPGFNWNTYQSIKNLNPRLHGKLLSFQGIGRLRLQHQLSRNAVHDGNHANGQCLGLFLSLRFCESMGDEWRKYV